MNSTVTSSVFSMDVQGDYDPCDASGFIKINAVRSVHPHHPFTFTRDYERASVLRRATLSLSSNLSPLTSLLLFPSNLSSLLL